MVMPIKYFGIFSFLLSLLSCNNSAPQAQVSLGSLNPAQQFSEPIEFDRSSSFERLKNKVTNKIPLVIHVMVPLCDNDNQGIVRVNENLGNGLNLRSNLYWGAMYGIRSYFKRLDDWELIKSQKDIDVNILERIIFKKTFANGTIAFLVADAYRGDKMKPCLIDYFDSISGAKNTSIEFDGNKLGINSQADLLIFNGHNGLMDHEIDKRSSKDGVIREAAVIGCISFEYFKEPLKSAKGYPILTTTNLLAPEAYVLEGIINSWCQLKEGAEIRKEAGIAYNKYQKCGIKGATRLFKTGW